MAYSKSSAASQLGISKSEFEKRAKDAGFKNTEDYWNSIGGDSAPLVQAIQKEMVALDRQIEELTPYLSLSDEEKQSFLDKALQEITPYYDSKKAEIEAGIKEGKVRTAEDILTSIRTVEEETKAVLAKYDLTQAQTEEEFVNRLADITSTTAEDLEIKRTNFQQQLEGLKASQIQQGTLTSGIGEKKRAEEIGLQNLEEQAIQRRSEAQQTSLETAKKYDLEQVQLARRNAEAERKRIIGAPEEAEATQQAALGTAGYSSLGELPSASELERLRTERGTSPIYNNNALTDLEREKLKARESTAQELQSDELARREAEYGAQIKKIQAERASKASKISAFTGGY